MPLPHSRLAVIHVAKARLELDDEAYRALLFRAAGVRSARELDGFGFNAVMAEFARLGFRDDFAKANLGYRQGMASPAQIALIRGLWGDVTAGEGNEKGLNTWLDRRFGVSALRFLAKDRVPKVVAGLKAWKKQRVRGEEAPAP